MQGLHELHVRPTKFRDAHNKYMPPEMCDMLTLGIAFAHLCLMDGSWESHNPIELMADLPESADKLRPPVFQMPQQDKDSRGTVGDVGEAPGKIDHGILYDRWYAGPLIHVY